jgi:hypothetical protein
MSTAKNAPGKSESTEVANRRAIDEIVPEIMGGGSVFDADKLRSLDNFDQALAMVADTFGEIKDASEELGDGFSLVEDKSTLVGKPMILMEWAFRDGDFGTFVSVRAMVKEPNGAPRKVIFNDGSTGIAEDLADWSIKNNGRMGGMVVHKGLRVSEYVKEIDGKRTPAKTYYLDTSK